MHAHPAADWVRYAITATIILLVMAWRFRQVGRVRRLRLETLWIVPALYAGLAVYIFSMMPPHGLGWLWCVVAMIAGCALGWKRGSLMAISIDPETHRLNQTSSLASLLFIVALILVRMGVRAMAGQMGWAAHGGILLLTDILVAFALGLLSVQRLEMFLRARRLLQAARTGD